MSDLQKHGNTGLLVLASADVQQVLCSHKALIYSKSVASEPSNTAEGLQVAGEFLECALVSKDMFGFRKS